jgi:CBS domain-containing protein
MRGQSPAMFQVHGLQGRLFSGSLDDMRRLHPVAAAARLRRLAPLSAGPEAAQLQAAGGPAAQTLAAYGASQGNTREPLTRVAEVMSRPVLAVPADATVHQAWQTLVRHRIGQAPVTAADGTLVGLAGRAELLPATLLDRPAADAAAWQALLAEPVTAVMWSPVPSMLPDTDLRQAAALLLSSGLPGAPVTDAAGQVLGFVSRSDLLRAMVADPPLDLWG